MSSSSTTLDKGKSKEAPTTTAIPTREQRALRRQAQMVALRRKDPSALAQQHKDQQAQLQEQLQQEQRQQEQRQQEQRQQEQQQQEQQQEHHMPQHQRQAGWGLEILLQAAQATFSSSLQAQHPQSLQTLTSELVLSPRELVTDAPVVHTLCDTASATPPSPPPPPSPPTTTSKERYQPQLTFEIWRKPHQSPAPGTGDTRNKKRKGEGDTDTLPRRRIRQTKLRAPDSEDENDIPETPEEAELVEDTNNASGLALNTHRAYRVPMKRWREFCKNNKAKYSGVDGKDLFLVDSEDKLIMFMKEYYFDKTSKKHVKLGADFKAVVPVKFGPDGQSQPLDPGALVNMMEEAEVDKNGCKVISVPLGTGSLQLVKKALLRLHDFQFKRNQLSCPSPTEGSKYRDTVMSYCDGQVQQNLQSSHTRPANCAIRDSYNLTEFNDMVSYLWEKRSQEIRGPDLNYRELFCMTSRQNMLLRDEDLRNLNLSDCFASIISKPRHPGVQQIVSLTFKLNKGMTNLENQSWYGCCLRHEDVRRCSFSAFAFYMFQVWQNSDHPDVRGLVVDDVPLEFSKDEWHLFKVLPSPIDPTTSLSPQATYNAVKKLYDRFNINSYKKTHGGRHSGMVESNRLGIPYEAFKEGGRWMADRGKMETFYSSNLPSAFALGMAGFQDKPYYLSRNGVNPPVKLQQMVFPWIEELYGKDNDEWRKECEAEMAEDDTNIVPPISTGPSSALSMALAESGESSKSAMTMACQDMDIAKTGFLRLLVRCRRIILQDAAFRLHYKQKSLILNHEIFQSPLFKTFQQNLGDFVDNPTPNPLQLAKEAMPEIVVELQNISTRLHRQERYFQTFFRDHQQLMDEFKQMEEFKHKEKAHKEQMEQALKDQREYYENLLQQQYNQQQQQSPLPLPRAPALHPPCEAIAPSATSESSSRTQSQVNPPLPSNPSRDPQSSFTLPQRMPIPRLSPPAPAQATKKTTAPKNKSKEKQFRFVHVTQKVEHS